MKPVKVSRAHSYRRKVPAPWLEWTYSSCVRARMRRRKRSTTRVSCVWCKLIIYTLCYGTDLSLVFSRLLRTVCSYARWANSIFGRPSEMGLKVFSAARTKR